MRMTSRTGLMSAGLGVGVVSGFIGSLLRERSALTAARVAAGEGSEEQPSWAVGSYRSRWTTFRTSPALPVVCLLGARPRQRRSSGKGGHRGAGEGVVDLGRPARLGLLRSRRLCGRGPRRLRPLRASGLCAAFHGVPYQPGVPRRGPADDRVHPARLPRTGPRPRDRADGGEGSPAPRVQGDRSLRRRPVEGTGLCAPATICSPWASRPSVSTTPIRGCVWS